MRINAEEITGIIKAQIKRYGEKIHQYDSGTVVSVSDGIVHIAGLDGCMANEMIKFEGGARGIALNLEEYCVSAALLSGEENVCEGTKAYLSGQRLSVPVGEKLLGRVVDALGNPIDGKGKIEVAENYSVERPAPGIMDRKSVSRPLETGIKAIDSMIPIGKGQRELIIGDRQTGKTTVAIDAILHQKDKNMICIYVAVGRKQSSVVRIAQLLEEKSAMEYSIIVSAPSSGLPSLEYIAPYSGCAIAEYFMNAGRDVLIVYDDLTRHAEAYRALSLLLKRSPGREAYPGDIFYLHSRLLERSAQMSDEKGGGSITALPIIETQAGDVSAYIPTNVISITDGQIFLEKELYRSGIRPAVNPGISVSRVGGSAQLPAMRRISGELKIIYSQFRELQQFVQFGADLDMDTKRRIDHGRRMTEVFKQKKHVSVSADKQAVLLYALINGFMNDIALAQVESYEAGLYAYLDTNCGELLAVLRENGQMSKNTEEKIRYALEDYGRMFDALQGENFHGT